MLAELRGRFAGVLMRSTVNFNTKLKEAASYGQPITEYDPGSRGYKDFADLARELMGGRPVAVEPRGDAGATPLSRPAELVQRARQLAQLSATTFGRTERRVQPPEPAGAITPTPTREKIDAAYGVRQDRDATVIRARFDRARTVRIAGDFNGWDDRTTPLARDGDAWTCRLPLGGGEYRYRFVVDGRWANDPHNDRLEQNEFGEFNNVLKVA